MNAVRLQALHTTTFFALKYFTMGVQLKKSKVNAITSSFTATAFFKN
jgi:hypothetical protein